MSRFGCASVSLSLRSLLVRMRRGLWVGLALSVGAHWCLSAWRGLAEERRVAKPLTTQFVKRQPRLTKPLELKKRPQPRRRQIRREMVAVKAKAGMEHAGGRTQTTGVLASLARPLILTPRSLSFADEAIEPRAQANAIEGAKESRHAVDMSLEMMDIEALDTGRYQAMVIVDPDDRRNIKGYLHLAMAYPLCVDEGIHPEAPDVTMNAVVRLVAKLNEWTGIKATVGSRVGFDSAEFLRTPWAYMWINYGMEPSRMEVESLGRYLLGGGFFFFEGHRTGQLQGERHLQQFVKSALESQGYEQGVDWEYELLAGNHPIFHCYYDFPGGPPPAHIVVTKFVLGRLRDDGEVAPSARGIEIGERLVALHTNQGYLVPWCAWGRTSAIFFGGSKSQYDPTIQFQFGINTIVFALTQEGSITRRLMDSIRH